MAKQPAVITIFRVVVIELQGNLIDMIETPTT